MAIPIGRGNASLVEMIKNIDSNIATLLPMVEDLEATTLKEFEALKGKIEAVKTMLEVISNLFTLTYFSVGALGMLVLIIIGVTWAAKLCR